MDDEIDIEEHDVLDHPAIKSIFPDLSIIKKEISSYEEQELNKKSNPGVTLASSQATFVEDSQNATCSDSDNKNSDNDVNISEEIQQQAKLFFGKKETIFNNKNSQDTIAEASKKACCSDSGGISSEGEQKNTEEIFQKSTKLSFVNENTILQSKNSQPITEESSKFATSSDSEDVGSEDEIKSIEEIQQTHRLSFDEEKLIFRNKIILGSKPTLKPSNEENHFEQNIKPYLANIYLDDIGSYLEKSGRFCAICCILFPHKGNLDTHTITCHEMSSKSKYTSSKSLKPANKKSIHKCEICSQTFTMSSNLMKHMRNIHMQKSQITFKPPTDRKLRQKSRLADSFVLHKSKSLSNSKCFHCKKIFSSQKNLIEHIYKVLQSTKISQKTQLKFMTNKTIKRAMTTTKQNDNLPYEKQNTGNTQDTNLHYKCYYCSFYFNEKKVFINHLSNKHKDREVTTTNKVKFDPNCRFCFAISSTINTYNVHLQQYHKDMVNETFKIQPKLYLTKVELILAGKRTGTAKVQDGIQINDSNQSQQSVQCSSKSNVNTPNTIAADSSSDVEKIQRKRNASASLTRYKKKLKVDEDAHEKSIHQEALNLIDSLVLKGILFKCKRCDINFLSNRCAMNHSEHMEFLINWKCHICLKIFKKHDEIFHKKQHSFSNEFVVYELSESKLSRVLYKCPKCAIHFDDNKYAFHYMHCGKIVTESIYCNPCDILLEKSVMQDHEYEHKFNNQSLSDFTIITSDVIDSTTITVTNKIIKREIKSFREKRKPSVNSNKSLDTLNMNYCVTCKCFISHNYLRTVHKEGRCAHMNKHVCKHCGLVVTMQSMKSHRNMHKLDKDLKLQNFKFYDVRSNKRILPPIPEYPKCKSCDVRFLSKAAVINHVCQDIDFLTCPICNIKLCDDTFKLHVSFHHYSLKRRNDNVLNNRRNTNRRILNENSIIKSESKSNYSINSCKAEDTYEENVVDISVQDSGRNVVVETMTHNQFAGSKQIYDNKPVVASGISSSKTDNYKIILNPERKTDAELHNVVYSCSYCYMTLMTYDQAVEHCQDHYYGIDFSKIIHKCTECKIKYDQRLNDHHKLHRIRDLQKTFTVLKFDAVYFAVDYKIWSENLFGILEPETKKTILNNSMYKYEGRMKLQVIQKGMTDLTVYKCSTCRMFVQPHAILSHIENSCFRLRKHICSFCGLPFVSHVFRMAHEKIHQYTPNLTVDSFNIVVFNRDKDKEYNKKIINSRNYFILYQCRKCKGLFERFQSRDHHCNNQNLKQCNRCGFLIYNSELKSHIVKHDLLNSFFHNNMKVIRFGKSDELNTVSSGLPLKFNGIVKDYHFYRCMKCDLHFKKSQTISEHNCVDTNSKVTCFKCNLTILKKDINQHYKIHDNDPYFVKENFDVLPYKGSYMKCPDSPLEGAKLNEDVCFIKADEIEKKISANKETNANSNEGLIKADDSAKKISANKEKNAISNVFSIKADENEKIISANKEMNEISDVCLIKVDDSEQKISTNKEKNTTSNIASVKLAKIYKCDCGQHFLDKVSINSHFGHCKSKILKQTCSKCSLLFSSKHLFAHLLKHHGDKKYSYRFDIIPMNKNKSKVIEIYNCSFCNLHFVEFPKAKEHLSIFSICPTAGSECSNCKLFFDDSSLKFHESRHHGDDIADFDIIDLKPTSVDSDNVENASLDKDIPNLTSQPDVVTESNYNISGEKSQLPLPNKRNVNNAV
ncbi:hypothetical protein evm_008186 [Chilo suppressalis]|nr:hypothetical protein evm_008186 [Chilo suppressalis]